MRDRHEKDREAHLCGEETFTPHGSYWTSCHRYVLLLPASVHLQLVSVARGSSSSCHVSYATSKKLDSEDYLSPHLSRESSLLQSISLLRSKDFSIHPNIDHQSSPALLPIRLSGQLDSTIRFTILNHTAFKGSTSHIHHVDHELERS